MFSSPAPRATPRKSTYRPPGSALRQSHVQPGSPAASAFSESRRGRDLNNLSTPSRSRLTALRDRDASPTSSAGETSRATAAVGGFRYDGHDAYGDRVYLGRDERMGLVGLGGMPKEVQEIVRRADLVNVRVQGHVDIATGYAFVTTRDASYAWNFAKRSQASPTVYYFPAPSSSSGLPNGQQPVSATFHHSGAAEPGLMLVSLDGRVHFWDTLGAALSNVDRYQFVELELGEGEYADRIYAVDATSYFITTTTSHVFRLFITSQAGRQTLSVQALVKSTGMFSRASPNIFSTAEDKEGIVSVAAAGGEAWIVAGKTAQKWSIAADSQKYTQELDLHYLIGKEAFAEEWNTGEIDLRIHDFSPAGSGRYAAVVSHTTQASTSNSSTVPSFALIILNTALRTGGLIVENSVALGYSPSGSRFVENPRVQMIGDTAFVLFSDVVVTVDTSPASGSEDIIALKDVGKNAFIGSSLTRSAFAQSKSKRAAVEANLVLLPAQGGLIGIEMYTPPIVLERKSETVKATERLKSKMEQAVFYGERRENPLTFDVVQDEDAIVAAAAEQVSMEILSALPVKDLRKCFTQSLETSPCQPAVFELRSLLNDRSIRLRSLIQYIRRNNLLNKLSQTARRSLSRVAEKAKGAIELWDHQDRLMNDMTPSSPASLLADSIEELMERYDGADVDDVVRQFFRTHIRHIDTLLDIVFKRFQLGVQNLVRSNDRGGWILETNKIFIIIIRAAAQLRETELSSYAIDRQNPISELWTASTSLLSAMEILYTSTVKLIQDRTREIGSTVDQGLSSLPSEGGELAATDIGKQRYMQETLKDQLTELAAAICANMEDKLRTTSRRQMVEGGDETEGVELKLKWDVLRPSVIRPLVEFDRIAHAFELAEHHNDFETLVWLCHSPVIQQNAAKSGKGEVYGTARLQRYIERFGEEFAFVLYQWYIDQDQQYALLNQDHVYSHLVSKFFASRGYPELAWVHHLACRRFGDGAQSLLDVQYDEKDQGQRMLFNSIGKLAAVADARSIGMDDVRRERLADFDNELGSLQIQAELKERIVAQKGRRVADPVKVYFDSVSAGLSDRPAFKEILQDLISRLSAGEALKIEDLVDVLTLKDNKGPSAGDAALALDRLSRDASLASGRKQVALLSIWRRVFIQDDWSMIAQTAGRSEDAQKGLLRGTATFATLQAIEGLPHLPKSFILTPLGSRAGPVTEELTARFPDFNAEAIQRIMADHEAEVALLERYIDEEDLEQRVREVADMVRREIAPGSGAEEQDEEGRSEEGDIDM